MALNPTVNKVIDKGSIKLLGKHSLSIGEVVLFIIAIVLLAKKGGVSLTNKWVILSLILILVAFLVW